jgi:hypothetical protein
VHLVHAARALKEALAAIRKGAPSELGHVGAADGLVYVAVCARDGRTKAVKHEFGNLPKQEICAAAMGAALDLFEEFLQA